MHAHEDSVDRTTSRLDQGSEIVPMRASGPSGTFVHRKLTQERRDRHSGGTRMRRGHSPARYVRRCGSRQRQEVNWLWLLLLLLVRGQIHVRGMSISHGGRLWAASIVGGACRPIELHSVREVAKELLNELQLTSKLLQAGDVPEGGWKVNKVSVRAWGKGKEQSAQPVVLSERDGSLDNLEYR